MNNGAKLNIIVVDLSVKKTSPAGSCVLSELVALSSKFSVHLFATELDDILREKVSFHEINTPSSPLLLRYISFSILVKLKLKKLLSKLEGPYVIQTTQGQYIDCNISYPHFCHREYLQNHWKYSKVKGVRRLMRWLNHNYHAYSETRAFSNAEIIVAPSTGLSRELCETYPNCKDKIKVIANPVDISYYEKPIDFDKIANRKLLGVSADRIIISFVALGDFERKGLPLLMLSLKERSLEKSPFLILVVGGNNKEILKYKKQSIEFGIESKIKFVGFHSDIRNYLWLSDLFALPSTYEVFPLVAIQAAAAGLPLLVSEIHGVEEYLIDGHNGWVIKRNSFSISEVLLKILNGKYNLNVMGEFATESVKKYDHENFRNKWLNVYEKFNLK